MNKITYIRKYDDINDVDDDTTVAQMRAKHRIEMELNRFWENAAKKWLEENYLKGQNIDQFISNWRTLKFHFTLNPTGTVRVEIFNCDEHTGAHHADTVIIPKRHLFN